jgi:alcohol dehydrogenase class IV
MMTGEFTFPSLKKVIYGPGSLSKLGAEIDRLGGERTFVVTGRTVARETSFVEDVKQCLGRRFVGVYARALPHSPEECVFEAADAARAAGADSLVSLGGGSSVDTAKMVSLCLAESVKDSEGLKPYRMRLVNGKIVVPSAKGRAMPHAAIPTTLSGGEFSQFGGCTDASRGTKHQYRHPDLAPAIVIQDPELAVATPSWLWGSTGLRAVDHCIEAVYSTDHKPFADALALESLRLLSLYLPTATANAEDLTARGHCQVAAWLSLYSLSNVMVGLSHAIGHQLGARCHVPHGVTSCLTLAAVMDFNRSASAERQALVAQAMGIDIREMRPEAAAAMASEKVRSIVNQIGIKSRLRDWKVQEADIKPIAEATMTEFLLATNPREVKNAGEVEEILRAIF